MLSEDSLGLGLATAGSLWIHSKRFPLIGKGKVRQTEVDSRWPLRRLKQPEVIHNMV